MKLIDLILILSFGAPLFISLISMGMMVAHRKAGNNVTKRKLLALVIGFFCCVFVSDSTVIFFIFEQDYYIYTSSLSFLTLLLSVVFLYYIVFLITQRDISKRFSPVHYIIPILLTVVHLIWSLFVPYNIQYDIVSNRLLDLENYKWFSLYYASKLWVYALYLVIYSILIFRKMPAYRQYVNSYSADEEKSSLHWLYMVIILGLIIIPVSFITFFINGRNSIIDEVIAIAANILYVIQIVTLQYNMFTENYVIASEDINNEATNTDQQIAENITKKEFEKYIKEKKPYLNQNLKITDLLYEFHTCRSYMSSFINSTYNMNFNCYINTLRMQEYEKLRKDPVNSKVKDSELITRAGFSYRSYLRFKKLRDVYRILHSKFSQTV